jgi:hypothetical protein
MNNKKRAICARELAISTQSVNTIEHREHYFAHEQNSAHMFTDCASINLV